MERWLGELARELRDDSYRPCIERQVLIPKKQPGPFRLLGIPCLRDRVELTAATLVLSPIFEADLQPEQYAYRAGGSALDAVQRVPRLANSRHREIEDRDLWNCFGEIPHAELLRSVARRVSDGRLLGWVKRWLEMAVVEDDGRVPAPQEPGAQRDAARGLYIPVPEQPLYAAVHPRGGGPRAKPGGSARKSSITRTTS